MYTLDSLATETQVRLGDSTGRTWSRDEVKRNLVEGYNQLCYLGRPLWDVVIFNDQPKASTHDFEWELIYAPPPILETPDIFGSRGSRKFFLEFVASGPSTYDFEWEKKYLPAHSPTVASSFDFEFERPYLPTGSSYPPAVSELPDSLQQVERVAWSGRMVPAISPLAFEWGLDQNYETTRGPVEAYMMNKDGHRALRRYRIPSGEGDYYTYKGRWGTFRAVVPSGIEPIGPLPRIGIFARMTDATTIYQNDSFITLSWAGFGFIAGTSSSQAFTGLSGFGGMILGGHQGVIRSIPGFHPSGGTRGVIRRIHLDQENTRVEFQRRGLDPALHSSFEIPDIYVRYCRHFAMAKAYRRDSPRQDLRMSKMYEVKWGRGVARLQKRIASLHNMKMDTMGDGAPITRDGRPPLARLPWPFPERAGRRRRRW